MATAFLFPGQGSQSVGMGYQLYEQYETARARFEAADEILEDVDLLALMFGLGSSINDPKEALKQTEVTQPALYTHSLAAMAVLDAEGVRPDMVAGHSLGEYSALAAAGALSFEDGLRVVRQRGALMSEAGTRRPGAMAAVLGADDDHVEAVCEEISAEEEDGVVHPANYNAPGQIVISGDVDAVERATEEIDGRSMLLPVSGAFHSPLMEYAREGLAEVLESVTIEAPRCPVYPNVTAEPTTDPDEIQRGLADQLLSPVQWAPTLRRMHGEGARRFVEVGTEKVLQGLVDRTLGSEVDATGAGTAAEMERITSTEEVGRFRG